MPRKHDTISFHRSIIKKALAISWKHKHLWIFGFFAAFSGLGWAFEPLVRVYDRTIATVPGSGDLLGFKFLPGLTTLRALISFSPSPWVSLFVYGLVGLVIFAVFDWIVVMALGAVISGVRAINKGKDLDLYLTEAVGLGTDVELKALLGNFPSTTPVKICTVTSYSPYFAWK